MLDIKFYHTNSPNNKIGKNLTDENILLCSLKNKCDVVKPVIVVKSDSLFDYNYCYIEVFKRYYFVTTTEISANNVYTLYLDCDVLESYKDSILKNYIHVTRKENSNIFGADVDTLKEMKLNHYEFDNFLKLNENYIMIVSRGNVIS